MIVGDRSDRAVVSSGGRTEAYIGCRTSCIGSNVNRSGASDCRQYIVGNGYSLVACSGISASVSNGPCNGSVAERVSSRSVVSNGCDRAVVSSSRCAEAYACCSAT